MRILSWNINGIRTLPQYHPWNSFKNCEAILDELGADIICFQEMKSSRSSLPRDVAIPDKYSSFFSFPVTKGGYSGVAIYSKSSVAVPLKAEEGLSGKLQPKPPLSHEERVSPSYPYVDDIEAFPDENDNTPGTFDALDSEGRALVLDFGLFVLINVYCPNETSDARLSFKMNYHLLLQERVRKLTEEEHREVIVLGDINICAAPIDHCDGHLPSNASTFYDHPARAWFHKWLAPNGPMIDVVRSFWQDRKGLFTCWNTKISARETNYGTRVDYILVTRGLMKWIKHGDIQPSLKGSDHCPIYIDLYDELTLESGESLHLRDALEQTGSYRLPPRIAAINWEEFSAKQALLSSFFGKKGNVKMKPTPAEELPSSQPKEISPTELPDTSESPAELIAGPSKAFKMPTPLLRSGSGGAATAASPSTGKKRTLPSQWSAKATTPAAKKRKKSETEQATLGAFFAKPKGKSRSTDHSSEIIELDDPQPLLGNIEPSNLPSSPDEDTRAQLEADYRLACELTASQESTSDCSSSQSASGSSSSKAAWSSLFTPTPPPKCTVHGEPAKKWVVNKQGPNKGRSFYVCSRPVGPGYDKGKNQRLRDEVDHRYRCNFFKWASDLKRETSSNGKG